MAAISFLANFSPGYFKELQFRHFLMAISLHSAQKLGKMNRVVVVAQGHLLIQFLLPSGVHTHKCHTTNPLTQTSCHLDGRFVSPEKKTPSNLFANKTKNFLFTYYAFQEVLPILGASWQLCIECRPDENHFSLKSSIFWLSRHNLENSA